MKHELIKFSVVQKQPPEVFCEKGVLRNFVKLTGRKHLCQGLLFNSYFYNLDQDPEPWTRTLDPDPGPWSWTRTLDPETGPWAQTLKTWTVKNLDPEKPGL